MDNWSWNECLIRNRAMVSIAVEFSSKEGKRRLKVVIGLKK